VRLEQRLQALWSGYGELWRVTLELGDSAVSAVVKDVRPPPDDASRSHRRKLHSYEVEQAFYARYAARCDVECRVPRAQALRREQGGFLSVLEDLEAAADFSGGRRRPSDDDIRATLRWLAKFHATFLGVAPDGLWKVGTYWHLATRPDELLRLKHAALRGAAGAIDARLSSARFKTFVHGDAKLENVCFARSRSAVALVDFQYVGGGVGVKDVAYFLSSCLSAQECEALVPRYLDQYFTALRAALAPTLPSEQAAELEHEWRSLFPLAWVDLYRFLLGWAPGQYDPDPYSDALLAQVLGRLSSR
jgi:hypothetical protein